MLFEPIVTGGCRSYLIAVRHLRCRGHRPEISQTDRYCASRAREGCGSTCAERIRPFFATHELRAAQCRWSCIAPVRRPS